MYSSPPWTKINGDAVTSRQGVLEGFVRRVEAIVLSLSFHGRRIMTRLKRHRERAVEIGTSYCDVWSQGLQNVLVWMTIGVICSDPDQCHRRVRMFNNFYATIFGTVM